MIGFLRRKQTVQQAPRLFLHIGMNKTGTTAIQHTLASSEKLLRDGGLLYPQTGRAGTKKHLQFSSSLGFFLDRRIPVEQRGDPERLKVELRMEAARANCPSILISSEAFMRSGDIARVRDYFAEWDCSIVIYLRRHDHWWASSYSQGLQWLVPPPWPAGFEGFIERQRRRAVKGDYRLLLDAWAEVFGTSRIIVRPYEREQNVPSITADLLTSIGHAELVETIATSSLLRNQSPGVRELQLIEEIQRAGLDERLRRRIVKRICERENQPKGNGVIPPHLRRQLVDEQLDDYAYIARTYLNRPDGRLFYEPLPDPQAAWVPPEPPSTHEIADAVFAAACPGCALCRFRRWRQQRAQAQ